MGSELNHYEGLRRQIVMNKRNYLNIQKRKHIPPFQPYYVTYELPKDDMFVSKEPTHKAEPTVHEFIRINDNQPIKFISLQDIHGNSSQGRRDRNVYSAKISNRYKNFDYMSQW